MEAPDLSLLTTQFVEWGGQIFSKQVNTFDAAGEGIMVMRNVTTPMVLPKIRAVGEPRPYRAADDLTDGAKITDRTLTVFQSKWDYDVDPEKFRNTYLADTDINPDTTPFYQYILQQVAKEYMAAINDITAWTGVRNSAGTGAVDIADGWGTIIAADITAAVLSPVVTGVITNSNAVAKVEAVAQSVPIWMRKKGFTIYCSYSVFDDYKTDYRSKFTFLFQPRKDDRYYIDGFANAQLLPVTWLGDSQRLVAAPINNLVLGTDGDSIKVAASMRRNIIEVRAMMPVGFQYGDEEALIINDQP